ncbi:unnamed protein product [Vicia faba]|uniref:Uncharacterized protein n=1 Tax=Vicia faba TaxID=3906 RepID=A0AAV1B4G9_VICFA|nr:unnamed protein product [Vicia faba]
MHQNKPKKKYTIGKSRAKRFERDRAGCTPPKRQPGSVGALANSTPRWLYHVRQSPRPIRSSCHQIREDFTKRVPLDEANALAHLADQHSTICKVIIKILGKKRERESIENTKCIFPLSEASAEPAHGPSPSSVATMSQPYIHFPPPKQTHTPWSSRETAIGILSSPDISNDDDCTVRRRSQIRA